MAHSSRGAELRQGEAFTLIPAAAYGATAGTNGTAVYHYGERLFYNFVLTFTNKDSEITDTCDVYIDTLINATWVNVVHFAQAVGTDAAAVEQAILDVSTPGATTYVTTADAAVSTVRQGIIGQAFRGRHVIVDGGGVAASFSFSLIGYAL